VAGVPATTKTPAAVTTTVTELRDSRVRLQVHVPASELEGRLERKANQLGRDLKLPGFRKGKVPAPLVIQRIGRAAVLEEAVRDTLSSWYSEAIDEAGVVPVGHPQVDLGTLPPQGEALEFSVEIGVLPEAELGAYEGLEVARREPVADPEQLAREIEGLRERLARLETAERAAAEGDFVVVDYLGSLPVADGEEQGAGGSLRPFAGGEGRDQLIELGAGNLIPGFEEALLGTSAGESLNDVRLTFPSDYGNEELAGREASFQITVKEVKRKQLPTLDDDLAVDAGFDGLDELREDISRRLLEADEGRVESEFLQAALDAAVAEAKVPLTAELIAARAGEMWERMLHTLSHRGISREAYLQIAGRAEEEILEEMQPDAELALRREAVIAAVVAAEGVDPSEQELIDAISPTAEREGIEPEKLLADLRSAGTVEEVHDDLAARKAVELIASRATPIPAEQAEAREKLWTPEKEGEQRDTLGEGPGRLWTPTDQRSPAKVSSDLPASEGIEPATRNRSEDR
jgi:trigger factor